MIERITEEARRLAIQDAEHRKRIDADLARDQQELVSQFHERRKRFAEISPAELEKARQEHSARFAPLEKALAGPAEIITALRDRYYIAPNGSKPTIVTVHHYNEPYREGGANLYSASLVLIDPDKTRIQDVSRARLAVVVSAYAHQNVPTKKTLQISRWSSEKRVVPGRLDYRVLAESRVIWYGKSPVAYEFLDRYERATKDLEVATPEHDLFQQTGHGIEFSSLSADYLDLSTAGKYLSGNEFDPNTGFLHYEGKSLEHSLALIISSKIPFTVEVPKHLYGPELTGQPA